MLLNQVYSKINEPIPSSPFLQQNEVKITDILNDIVTSYLKGQEKVWKSNPRLYNNRKPYEMMIRNVFTRKSILMSFDVEAWEKDTNIVTEIGVAIYDPKLGGGMGFGIVPTIFQIHTRIRESLELKNGEYVPDHVDNFNGGVTLVLGQDETGIFLQSLIDFFFGTDQPQKEMQYISRSYLVGHGLKGDIKWLTMLGVKLPENILTIDTSELMKVTHGQSPVGLARALNYLDIPHNFLHNAGNDAYYTLLLALKLCDPYVRMKMNLDVCLVKEMTEEEKRQNKRMKEKKKLERQRARLEEEANSLTGIDILALFMDESTIEEKRKLESEKMAAREAEIRERMRLKSEKLKKKIATCNDAELKELRTATQAIQFVFDKEALQEIDANESDVA
ncbi:hypothetical protein KGF56_002108 [Candida oxycetoniae]|uniref:Gfd2/YDR514C-like C-terminal domain-containing protein n=1 Tax=Candida oxycetoniae TaxID=497107 RepID=A0AAI9WYA0_9ASCO|nr:uncharacterized protein KGF56_002108 [Candida oxycetoniae]KAI3405152.2 hypothetical protein KGF56_002108 [Candida oxycetoniae]